MSLKSHGIAHIGRDAEVRYTPNGSAVANLALAFSYRDKSGGDATQWVDAVLWGKQAESLGQYLTKGKRVSVDLRNVRLETYEGKNGPASKLVGDVVDLEFASTKSEDDKPSQQRQEAPRPAPQPRPAPSAPPRPASGFDDMDDDVPF